MVDVVAKILWSTLEMSPKPLVRQTEDTLRIQPIHTHWWWCRSLCQACVLRRLMSYLPPILCHVEWHLPPILNCHWCYFWRETGKKLNPRFGEKPGSYERQSKSPPSTLRSHLRQCRRQTQTSSIIVVPSTSPHRLVRRREALLSSHKLAFV